MEYRCIHVSRCWCSHVYCCRCWCSYSHCCQRFRSYALELTVSELAHRCRWSCRRLRGLSTSSHQQPVVEEISAAGSSVVHVMMTARHDPVLERWHFVFAYVIVRHSDMSVNLKRHTWRNGCKWRKEIERKDIKEKKKEIKNIVWEILCRQKSAINKLEHRFLSVDC